MSAATLTVPTIFSAIDRMSSPMDMMSKKSKSFQDRLNSAGKAAGIGALAIGAFLGVALNSASGFEASMSNVGTLVDANVEDMDKMGKSVLELSRKLPVPIDELTTSLYDIRSAGISANDAISTLETSAKLSKAGLSTASESTNILTSAMNAFAGEGKSSEEIANILFKTVKYGKTNMSELSQAFGANAAIVESSGTTLADFSAATAALTTVGTPASQAQNQIRASIIAMQKPTQDMTKIFHRLGVSSEKDLISREGGLVGAFEAINQAGTEMGINMSKAWSSTEAGAAVTSLLGSTNQAYLTSLKDMVGGTDALTEAYEKQHGTMASKIQLAKNNMEAFSITLGTQLIPVITSLFEKMTPLEKFRATK
jgi:TP901 family phage tail tape measure protein